MAMDGDEARRQLARFEALFERLPPKVQACIVAGMELLNQERAVGPTLDEINDWVEQALALGLPPETIARVVGCMDRERRKAR